MTDEIQRYLELERRRFPAYHNKLTDVSAQLGHVPTEASVFVLVPVHSSERNIGRLLENYARQTLTSNKFEVVLFLNRTVADPDFSAVKEEIKIFKSQSSMWISVLEHEFSSRAPIGLIRKIVNDVCLIRGTDADALLVNNDADSLDIDPNYLEEMLAMHAGKNLLTTQSQHYADAVYEIPIFGEITAMMERIESAYGTGVSPHAFVSAWCGNLVTNATAYAKMSGFDPGALIGEELVFAHFFVKKFGAESFKRTAPHITTSCRRIAHNFIQRHDAKKVYADFFTADIRGREEHEIHDLARQASAQCGEDKIMGRLADEFRIYLERLASSMPDREGATAENRLDSAVEIFGKVLAPMNIKIKRDHHNQSVSFTRGSQTLEIKV
jgi:hypothetical protein